MGTASRDADTEPNEAGIRDALGPSAEVWEQAVEDGYVRVTFYFAERHRAVLVAAGGLTAEYVSGSARPR
ncbi:hypothetical protein NSZ01_20480 [Nocardioides szechwanensis]|uniref:Uncharacterized protein n=1 Tax=Nocardioides szechwanensis TaxID=1005944 RepID=A0A1H0HF53_9ACTN|nr:hypothetical protein [Nocardioides szechwanensis]GEP34280.1 hypothetical protein NSZ01_20480 [Nocardioides szechwanensis]SDO17839.1 hypothetical protein SAMN05192576_3564 [Nocardioides szechwanensis]